MTRRSAHTSIFQHLRRCLACSAAALAFVMGCPTAPAQSQQAPQGPTKEPEYIPFTYSEVQAMDVTESPYSKDASLAQFAEQLLEYARNMIRFSPKRFREETPITVLAMRDPTLAKHPHIRDLTMRTLFEINTFQITEKRIEQSIASLLSRPPSMPASIPYNSSPFSPGKSTRRVPEPMRLPPSNLKAVQSLRQDLEARRKIAEANIENRSKLMASKAETPAGQEFLMPNQSPFFLALQVKIIPTQKNPGK